MASTLPSLSGGIPHEVFDARALPRSERFDVWRQSVMPLFEPHLEEEPAEGFFARVDGFNLRRVFFCRSEFSAQRYLRRRGHHADEGADHLLIQLYMSGGYVGHNGGRMMRMQAGDISLLDLGYALETRTEASSTLSLVVPRDVMFSFVRSEQLRPGSTVSGTSALGEILGHHFRSVWSGLHSASAEEAETICNALVGTVAGAFAVQPSARLSVQETGSTQALETICDYIERHLASNELTTAHLCHRFACSRAQLYRLFQPLSGVAAYIRQARLRRCYRELRESSTSTRSIVEVAMRWGFNSQSHFCRLFRQSFGITPTQAIEQGRARRNALTSIAWHPHAARPAFHHWIQQLS